MSPERWARIEALFGEAVALPEAERAGFLEGAAGDDLALRDEVASLLSVSTEAPTLIRDVIGGEAVALHGAKERRIGPYRLVSEIGHGGMGTVYLAQRDDDQYRTQVAIKLLHRGLADAEAVARFRDERQILAALQHPGIVRLLDGGTAEGLPYLVMERVEGEPIIAFAERRDLSVRARIELFRQVAAAVHFAHQRLVVHRDIKPSNILVTDDGTPKLLDFGIAKLLDTAAAANREAHTRTGVVLLTPEYASPEQVRGELVSTATDVYSLGAVLYELLSGAKAQPAGAASLDMARAVLERDPPRPSAVAPPSRRRALAGDLDNIVLKALHKEATRRYASAEQLSEDLGRHLEGLPVQARASTWRYRTGKFVKRNRALVGAGAVVLATLVTATAVSLAQAERADAAARSARERFADVRKLANSLLFEVDDKIRGIGGTTSVRELIARRALEYLDKLAASAADDVTLRRELAAAYVKVGDVQGNTLEPSLGRLSDALESYGKARALLTEQLLAQPDDDEARRLLVKVHFVSGHVLNIEGRHAEARRAILEATRLSESLPAGAGLDRLVMMRGLLTLLAVEYESGDVAAADLAARRVLDGAADWMRHEPSSAEARYWLGVGHEARSYAASLAADPDTALAELARARETFASLTAEHPNDQDYARELGMALMLTAQTQAGIGNAAIWKPDVDDWPGAEASLREAEAIFERPSVKDPDDARAAIEWATTLSSLAAVVEKRDPPASLSKFEEARATFTRLPAPIRTAGYARDQEWYTHCAMAEALASAGRREDALSAAAVGVAMVERATARPDPSLVDRHALLACRYLEARAQRALGDEEAAARLLDEVAGGLRTLIRDRPDAVTSYIGLGETLTLLAELRPADRCALLGEALAAWRAWPGTPTRFTHRMLAQFEAALVRCSPNP